MKAKYLRNHGNMALVMIFSEEDLTRVYLVDNKFVRGIKVNEEFDISQDAISAGTEFSIDWDIIVPEGFDVPMEMIHEALISRGVYTFEDFRSNQQLVNDAFNVIVGQLQLKLTKKVKELEV